MSVPPDQMPSPPPSGGGPDASAISQYYEGQLNDDTAALADIAKQDKPPEFVPPGPEGAPGAPQRQPGITAVAPLLIGLAALGGKAAGIHATTMLGATNGMVEGLIKGNEQKYRDQKQAYDTAYQQYQDKWNQQQKIYNEMRQVYKGRVDADLKALQFARQVTGDQSKVDQNAVKNFQQAQIINDKFHKTKIDESYKQGELLLKKRKLDQDAEKLQQTDQPSITMETADLMAARLANGEKASEVFSNLGRGKQGAANLALVQNRFTALSLGQEGDPRLVSAAEHIATQKQVLSAENKERQVEGGIAGKIRYAEEEITRIAPKVLEASAKVPRGEFVPWNELKQKTLTATSDPNLKQLKSYMNTLSNSYDVLAARGGTDMEKRKHNREMFDTADSPEALQAAVDAVMTEASISGEAADASIKPRTPAAPQKQVTRTGVDSATGRKVVQYSDGSVAFAE